MPTPFLLNGILASQISGHLYSGPAGAFDALGSVTVGSGGQSSITFSAIPQTYTHLQLRYIGQSNRTAYPLDETHIQFNGDTGANYAQHALYGNGASAAATNVTSGTDIELGYGFLGDTSSNVFGVGVLDILDYTNANKNKVIRFLGGIDMNGTISSYGGRVGISSGLWLNTSSISSFKLFSPNGNFNQYSNFSLYGIR